MRIKKNNIDKWELLLKVLTKELDEDDLQFQNWLNQNKENRELYKSLIGEGKSTLFDNEKMYNNITKVLSIDNEKNAIKLVPEIQKKKSKKLHWLKYASIAIILLISSIVLFNYKFFDAHQIAKQQENIDINLLNKKAKLTLANGQEINLDEKFDIVDKEAINIANDPEQGLFYKNANERIIQIEYHKLEVPVGASYELELEDGTKVYLNSASKLIYPSSFDSGKRMVRLQGEAYFDVAKNGQPFTVHTGNVDIVVMGTAFNVSAYEHDAFVNTTLVNGKVQVLDYTKSLLSDLEPGYNHCYDTKSGKSVTQKVDIKLYTSWLNGSFYFRDQTLEDILTKLSRWYDFSVSYEDPSLKYLRFSGSSEKNNSIDFFLKKIGAVTNVKYKKNGKEIIIYR